MARSLYIYGNWKMHNTLTQARELAQSVVQAIPSGNVVVGMAPVFVHISAVRDVVPKLPHLRVLAQNGYPEPKGAFTGEVAFVQLKEIGCDGVILGHSERRQYFHETDEIIARKVVAALHYDLEVVFCVGETLDERESGQTWDVVKRQVDAVLPQVPSELRSRLIVAYEPVWAIGTGRTATPQQAQEVHAMIRKRATELWDAEAAQNLIIQYGGSVKPENAKDLFSCPDIDGGLVGGASLDATSFARIVSAALISR